MKLKTGDEVRVIRGKDSGKTGKVQRVFSKEAKVLVDGVNQYKRHVKARTRDQKSEIITITKPLPVAGVVLICPKCNKPTRVGFAITKDIKERVCKKCGGKF